MNDNGSILISCGWIASFCGLASIFFIGITLLYVYLYWRNYYPETATRFWSLGLRRALLAKFYEIFGFAISSFALLFAIFSMYNTGKLERAKFPKPIIELDDVKYKVDSKEELKLEIKVLKGIIPNECRIEFIPIFRIRDKKSGLKLSVKIENSKDFDDFPFKITKKIVFEKDKNLDIYKDEIKNLLSDICYRPSYKPHCDKFKTKEAELVRFYYKIWGKIGLSKEKMLEEGYKNVLIYKF